MNERRKHFLSEHVMIFCRGKDKHSDLFLVMYIFLSLPPECPAESLRTLSKDDTEQPYLSSWGGQSRINSI